MPEPCTTFSKNSNPNNLIITIKIQKQQNKNTKPSFKWIQPKNKKEECKVYVGIDSENDKTTKSDYALYWDEDNDLDEEFKTGFYVKSEDSIKFLEEKLNEIGLTEREANEFITYWLPILENNKKNLVNPN